MLRCFCGHTESCSAVVALSPLSTRPNWIGIRLNIGTRTGSETRDTEKQLNQQTESVNQLRHAASAAVVFQEPSDDVPVS